MSGVTTQNGVDSPRVPRLELSKLSVSVAGIQVCHEFNVTLTGGQCWAVIGANGVGKTTLLHTLAGLREPDQGLIRVDGLERHQIPRRQLAQRLGLVLQDEVDPFPSSVLQTALIGRHPHLRPWQWEGPEDLRCANHALQQFGLGELAKRSVATLSGGERRRLALAALMVQDPQIMLLDEPTNHLDLHHRAEVLRLFAELVRSEQRLVVMVLHDINLAVRYCSHVILMAGEGRCRSGTTEALMTEEILSETLHHPLARVQGPDGPAFLPR